MVKIFGIILLSAGFIGTHAQELSCLRSFYNNRPLKCSFNRVYAVINTETEPWTMTPHRYLTYLDDISRDSLQCLLDPNNEQRVLDMLAQDSTDWEINLVLYALTERDATLLFAESISQEVYPPSKAHWRESYKPEEIEYWRWYFHTRRNSK